VPSNFSVSAVAHHLLVTRLFIPRLSTEWLKLQISGKEGRMVGPRSARKVRWKVIVIFLCLKPKMRVWLVSMLGVLPAHINPVIINLVIDRGIIADGKILMGLLLEGLALFRDLHKGL
jgi:hypothetical protein